MAFQCLCHPHVSNLDKGIGCPREQLWGFQEVQGSLVQRLTSLKDVQALGGSFLGFVLPSLALICLLEPRREQAKGTRREGYYEADRVC